MQAESLVSGGWSAPMYPAFVRAHIALGHDVIRALSPNKLDDLCRPRPWSGSRSARLDLFRHQFSLLTDLG